MPVYVPILPAREEAVRHGSTALAELLLNE